MAQKKGTRPLFLLDDLSSELDSKRRQSLLEILMEKTLQVFVSTTSLSVLEIPIENSMEFQIFDGKISPS
jgi:DNA replication and repair protein RecF